MSGQDGDGRVTRGVGGAHSGEGEQRVAQTLQLSELLGLTCERLGGAAESRRLGQDLLEEPIRKCS